MILLGTCILNTDTISSSYNISNKLEKNQEMLILGHCYDEYPRFSISAINNGNDINLILNDESDNLTIMPFKNGGALYNYTSLIQIERNYQFVSVGAKWYVYLILFLKFNENF